MAKPTWVSGAWCVAEEATTGTACFGQGAVAQASTLRNNGVGRTAVVERREVGIPQLDTSEGKVLAVGDDVTLSGLWLGNGEEATCHRACPEAIPRTLRTKACGKEA